MPFSYYYNMGDRNHANQLRTISPSATAADHNIPDPPPFLDQSMMLPLRAPANMEKQTEKNVSNVGRLAMDLAENRLEDRTRTHTVNNTSKIPPAATRKDASTILPAPTERGAVTIPPVPTEKPPGTTLPSPSGKETSMNPSKPTNPKQRNIPKPDWDATPRSHSSGYDDDDTEH